MYLRIYIDKDNYFIVFGFKDKSKLSLGYPEVDVTNASWQIIITFTKIKETIILDSRKVFFTYMKPKSPLKLI